MAPVYQRHRMGGFFMALNIKNEETHRLASELAEATGTTLTEAVTRAVRDAVSRTRTEVDVDAIVSEVAEIQRFVAELPDRDTREPDEILGYDPRGLPG
jgi:antitoxin VapB